MKSWLLSALVFQALCAFSFAALPDFCTMDPDPGFCMAYFPRYFHNSTSGECEKFVYGGCQGNGNNFEKKEDCESACTDVCVLPKKSGPCMAYFPRYYFDSQAGSCKQFVYGGCMGNGNNFENLEDCEIQCP